MSLYFDTSALIKLVIEEDGSELAEELWRTRERAASSLLCYPEARAAIAAARRRRRLNAGGYTAAVRAFDTVHAGLHLVGIDAELARLGAELAEKQSLRGYDAVHLASALRSGSTIFVTWDLDLARAARVSGLGIAPAA